MKVRGGVVGGRGRGGNGVCGEDCQESGLVSDWEGEEGMRTRLSEE